MKPFKGYDDAKKAAQYNGGGQLPLGTYVCVIKNVQFQAGKDGNSDIINILYDVDEGDYKDFFQNKYDESTDEDKKWKGRASIWLPTDDGSEKDGWTKNAFARWTDALEKSNPGYVWDWDENKWKGKKIGLRMRQHGIVTQNGEHILFNDVDRPFDVDYARKNPTGVGKIKEGNGFDMSQVKRGNSDGKSESNDFVNVPEGVDEEIPF